MTARRLGNASLIVALVCCGGPTDTASIQVPEPTGSGSLTGWYSDWATQTADLGHVFDTAANDRMVDRVGGTPKWSGGTARLVHQEVVTAPPGAPFAKWIEFEFQGPNTNSGQSEILHNGGIL